MIIFGSRGLDLKRGEGTFFCPNCQTDRVYNLKERKRMGHLYWIPLLPLGSLGKFIECKACSGTFHEDAQYMETNANIENKLSMAIKTALSAVILADNVTDKSELAMGSAMINEYTNEDISVEQLEEDLNNVNLNDLSQTLGEISPHLSEQGKVGLLQKCVLMSIADGELDDSEIEIIKNIAIGLEIPPQYVQGIIQETFEVLTKNQED